MFTKHCIFFMLLLCSITSHAQDDTAKHLQEVVVTATRTERSIGNIPIPITIITKKQIQQSGLQKLSDVLQQSGLQLANNILGQSLQGYPNPFGTGVQLQGLDAGYTLILLDGQPLTGRNAGVLNLDRIPINNIKQIEIIKGPAASLYGADALAGVINIITGDATTKTNIQLSYASHQTLLASLSSSIKYKKNSLQLFASGGSSEGYDLDKNIYGKTIDPSNHLSVSVKNNISLSPNTIFKNTIRYFNQHQLNNYLVYTQQQPEVVTGTAKEADWGILNELTKKWKGNTTLSARLYITGYDNQAKVYLQNSHLLFDNAYLKQLLIKNEYLFETSKKVNNQFVSGIGFDYETINSSRYAAKKELNNIYGFVQKETQLLHRFNIVAGLRFDKHQLYKAQINPRIAVGFKAVKNIDVALSFGNGFKTPDFRQQFLFFTNAVVGYTLLGNNELYSGLQQMQQQGQLSSLINIASYQFVKNLLPEKSTGMNAEAKWQLNNKTKITAGFFRNDITHLIERYTLPFAKTNGQSIFSYQNINKIYTQGFNVFIKKQLFSSLQLITSYQYLNAKDKDVVIQIKNNQVVKRDPATFISSYTTMNEYGGLFNRSKHSAAMQLTYFNTKKQLTAGLRTVYTGKYGYSDVNGNAILDDDREYGKSYFLLGCVFSQVIKGKMQVQAGADNLLAYIDKVKLPSLSGRTFFINTNFYLSKLFTKDKTIRK